MSMEKHPLHIKMPELQKSQDVQDAVEREERLAAIVNEELKESGQEGPLLQEKIPNEPSERIEVYMDRLENIFLNEDERIRERNLEVLHDKIYEALIINKENFPESYFELQKRIARERGMGDVEITPEMREQMMDTAIEDQKHSLDAWINYLTEEDVAYPPWFKYYVWNQIIKLSQFDKERGEFKRRTPPYSMDKDGRYAKDENGKRVKIPNSNVTVAPFPDIHRGALAQILDVYEKVKEDNKNLKDPEIQEAFSKKFPTFYAELISKSLAEKIENKESIQGEWIKYNGGDEAEANKLFESMQGKGTGWCVEGKGAAQNYIKGGDFYVYYSNDNQGNPIQPRLAIQMTGNQIGQIRGILPHQEVEPVMQEVLDEKLKDFGQEADSYRKKSEDMKRVTALERKQEKNEEFTIEDLLFIYQVNSEIENFGYNEDPRIDEILERRNTSEDTLALAHYIVGNKDNFSKERYAQAEGTLRLEQISRSPDITGKDLLDIYQIVSPVDTLPYDKDGRLKELLANRDSEKDYTAISHYVLDNSEQFSDDHQKKAQDTLRLYELEHKLVKNNEADLTREELVFLYAIESPTKTFNMDLLRGVNELKRNRRKHRDAYTLAVRNTELVDKVQKSVPLTKEDFEYLFELNGQKVEEYLGQHDDRIGYAIEKVDLKNNLHVMFECLPKEIAYTPKQINEKTKVWVGEITNKVLEKLPDGIVHIHNEFPRYTYDLLSYRRSVQSFFETNNYASRLPYERKYVSVKEKIKNGDSLDKDDLMYLYQMDNRHSIINHEDELQRFRHKRNSEEDMLVIFGCSKDEIAHNIKEITEKTKIYVGKFEQDLFKKLPESIEHVYRDFSWYVDHRYEAKIEKVQVGGKNKRELLRELETSDFRISDYARKLIDQAPTSSQNSEPTEVTFVTVTCGAFGLEKSEFTTPHYSELERRAMDAGLYRCSTEAALSYILDKKPERNLRVAITDTFGRGVLSAHREYKKTNYVLDSDSASLEAGWYRFLFRVSK